MYVIKFFSRTPESSGPGTVVRTDPPLWGPWAIAEEKRRPAEAYYNKFSFLIDDR